MIRVAAGGIKNNADQEANESALELTIPGISELRHCRIFLLVRIAISSDVKRAEGAVTRACDTMEPVDYMMALFAGMCIGFAALAFVYGG
jgi:hypothetical protein